LEIKIYITINQAAHWCLFCRWHSLITPMQG